MNDRILENDILDLAKSHTSLLSVFDRKTILITGASGFIGSFIIRLLLHLVQEYAMDIKLILLATNADRIKKRIGKSFDEDRITIISQDVVNPFRIDHPVDYVIHAASKANPKAYMEDPTGTITTNVIGTNNLLSALQDKPVKKILYLSTVEAYGQHNQNGPLTEDIAGIIDPAIVRSCYPLSKICTENLCLCYADQYRMPITIARLGYIYGPGDNIEDSKVVTSFMNDIKNGRNITLKSAGTQKRTYCYIKDAVFGILLALTKGEEKQIYNVSSQNNTTTIKGIADLIVELFGDKSQKVKIEAPSEKEQKGFSLIQDNILDNTKIKSLGYQESIDIRQGLFNTGEYFELKKRHRD